MDPLSHQAGITFPEPSVEAHCGKEKGLNGNETPSTCAPLFCERTRGRNPSV